MNKDTKHCLLFHPFHLFHEKKNGNFMLQNYFQMFLFLRSYLATQIFCDQSMKQNVGLGPGTLLLELV